MNWSTSISRTILGALLFALLIGVQTISIAHAYEHDAVSIGDTACATCISVNQLAAAAVDTGHAPAPVVSTSVRLGKACDVVPVTSADVPKQRGPPAIILIVS